MHISNTLQRRDVVRTANVPDEVIAITRELFPGPIELSYETDPETPDEPFLMLMVRASGKPKEVVQRRREWHRRVGEALPNPEIRLVITSTAT